METLTKPVDPYFCRICGEVCKSQYFLTLHRKTQHGTSRKAPQGVDKVSPLDKIYDAQHAIQLALKDLDVERTTLMNRVKEIDDICAKYKMPIA